MTTRLRRIPRPFFARDTCVVARELLGKVLVHVLPDGMRLSGRIVETEAYRPGDRAAHSFRGLTARNAPMFGRPGTAYVYFTYGLHHCFNVSTEGKGVGAAVLIRALEPLEGIDAMRVNRGKATIESEWPAARDDASLCRGPGNLCKAMGVDRSLSGLDTSRRDSPLFIVDDCYVAAKVETSARIGVSGDELAKTVPWRYFIAGHPCVSGKGLRNR